MSAIFWLMTGLVLMLAELAIPGFIIFFFGVGALVSGAAVWLVPGLSPSWQLGIFLVGSLLSLWLCRRFLRQTFRGHENIEPLPLETQECSGELAVVTADIAPASPGRVSFQGTDWRAESAESLSAGSRVRIVERRNVVLLVAGIKSKE